MNFPLDLDRSLVGGRRAAQADAKEAGSLTIEKLLLTYDELAALTSISVPTLKRLKAAKRIPCVQLGHLVRFDPRDVVDRLKRGA